MNKKFRPNNKDIKIIPFIRDKKPSGFVEFQVNAYRGTEAWLHG